MISVYLRLTFASLLLALGLLIGAGGSLQAARPGAAPTPPMAVPTPSFIPTPAPTTLPPAPPTYPTMPLAGLTACSAQPSWNGSRMFPQTGHAMTGIFLQYWDVNGGLAQQGYPISELMPEVSDLDGVTYQVQYFERAVFEYHPENDGTGYDVLLAQLGTYQYRQKYPNGAPGQRPNGEHPRYFAETGHTLGGEFGLYWAEHGGLRQQGYPLSDEFTEISPLDGKPYTVQYFERSVMEYHPENQTPYRVLLSQLGTLRYRTKYPAPPGPSPTPDPAAARYLGDVFNTDRGTADFTVAGGTIYWFDGNRPYKDSLLLGYDVAAGRAFTVAPRPVPSGTPTPTDQHQSHVVTDGRTVVWTERALAQASPVAFIHGYNTQTGQAYAPVPYNPRTEGFAVDGDMLYYLDSRLGNAEIRARNWTTGQDTLFTLIEPGTAPGRLVAGNGDVVWAETVGSQYLLRIAPGRDPSAARSIGGGQADPLDYILAGDQVIWTTQVAFYPPVTDIHMYNLSTGATRTLAREPSRVDSLSAAGDRIAWRRIGPDDTSPCLSLAVLDLRSGVLQVGTLPSYGGRQVALVGPNTLVYPRLGEPFQLYLQPLQ